VNDERIIGELKQLGVDDQPPAGWKERAAEAMVALERGEQLLRVVAEITGDINRQIDALVIAIELAAQRSTTEPTDMLLAAAAGVLLAGRDLATIDQTDPDDTAEIELPSSPEAGRDDRSDLGCDIDPAEGPSDWDLFEGKP
jgi:hypothetical protein